MHSSRLSCSEWRFTFTTGQTRSFTTEGGRCRYGSEHQTLESNLHKWFKLRDANNDGYISRDEFLPFSAVPMKGQ
jgi:hypothetical protein